MGQKASTASRPAFHEYRVAPPGNGSFKQPQPHVLDAIRAHKPSPEAPLEVSCVGGPDPDFHAVFMLTSYDDASRNAVLAMVDAAGPDADCPMFIGLWPTAPRTPAQVLKPVPASTFYVGALGDAQWCLCLSTLDRLRPSEALPVAAFVEPAGEAVGSQAAGPLALGLSSVREPALCALVAAVVAANPLPGHPVAVSLGPLDGSDPRTCGAGLAVHHMPAFTKIAVLWSVASRSAAMRSAEARRTAAEAAAAEAVTRAADDARWAAEDAAEAAAAAAAAAAAEAARSARDATSAADAETGGETDAAEARLKSDIDRYAAEAAAAGAAGAAAVVALLEAAAASAARGRRAIGLSIKVRELAIRWEHRAGKLVAVAAGAPTAVDDGGEAGGAGGEGSGANRGANWRPGQFKVKHGKASLTTGKYKPYMRPAAMSVADWAEYVSHAEERDAYELAVLRAKHDGTPMPEKPARVRAAEAKGRA